MDGNSKIRRLEYICRGVDESKETLNELLAQLNNIRPMLNDVKKEIAFVEAADEYWEISQKKKANKTPIRITDKISIDAIPVKLFSQVKQNGELYYVLSAEHFAVCISGHLFHGNIGEIFTDNKQITKIKDCKYVQSCSKHNNCNYYHNPMLFSGSHDIRNYVNNSWAYYQFNNKTVKGRPFGNRSTLDLDLRYTTKEDSQKIYDQTMHDILCSIILMNIHNN